MTDADERVLHLMTGRLARYALLIGIVLATAAACVPPLSTPGDISAIQLISSSNQDGWHYDYYRNNTYPCSVSGYQTFVVGTKQGSSATAPAPLWAFMHGGGAGYFDENGNPIPNANGKDEETFPSLRTYLVNNALVQRIKADAAGFRTLAVSYCSHEIYGGVNTPDPHNPNTTPDGKARTTNGDLATKAAVQFVQSKYPTTKTFLHGTSAGSAGTFGVAWSMQLQGIPPAGIVADASVVNTEGFQAGYAAGICTADGNNDPARVAAVAARIHPDLANIDNEPDKLVAGGRLTVPIMHIWNHGDHNTCGALPVACPMRDGTTVTMGYTDCLHEPMRRAIAAEGLTSRSTNLPVCVDADTTPDCDVHVVTSRALVNTDPSTPPDYISAIVGWVDTRLGDP